MLSTTTHSRGDVILAPFPFTNLRTQKYRPALVISNDSYNQATGDVIIAQITGNVTGRPRQGDYVLQDWQAAGLRAPSLVRAKLVTVASSLVQRGIGTMPQADMTAIENTFRMVMAL